MTFAPASRHHLIDKHISPFSTTTNVLLPSVSSPTNSTLAKMKREFGVEPMRPAEARRAASITATAALPIQISIATYSHDVPKDPKIIPRLPSNAAPICRCKVDQKHLATFTLSNYLSPSQPRHPLQSLAQINVLHLHCVFFSFPPVGPTGLGQIQNARPQLTPGFFVVRLMQGSLWSSQRGGFGLEKSLSHDSFETIGSMKGGEDGPLASSSAGSAGLALTAVLRLSALGCLLGDWEEEPFEEDVAGEARALGLPFPKPLAACAVDIDSDLP